MKNKQDKSDKESRPKRKSKPSFALWFLKWTVIISIWGILAAGLASLWFGYDLPDINKLSQSERRPSVVLLAKDGKTRLAAYGDLHGTVVKPSSLPPHVVQALMAIEDRRFYYHFGVDPIGLVRAFITNSIKGRVVQGGSTLTQQLAKNFLQAQKLYDVNDKSFRRKVQEAMLALWLEWKFTKDQILTMYLNRVYFGAGTFGIEAAARHYFDKPAKKLTLYESAVLAGLLKAPSKYSPTNNSDQADQRAQQVLIAMVDAGFIDEDLKEATSLMGRSGQYQFVGNSTRYFCDWVIESIHELIGNSDQDLVVVTTLDPHLQKMAESEMRNILEKHADEYNGSQMALVSMTPNGAVRAMIGGANYKQSQFNRATQALRQPGSVFKLYVYLAALEHGYSPQSMISDLPVRLGGWSPKNFKYQSRGEITLKDALAFSVNTATVRLAKNVGYNSVLQMARKMGLGGEQPKDLTIVLGTGQSTLLDLTKSFAVIANGGRSVSPYGILSIKANNQVIYTKNSSPNGQLLSPRVAQEMTEMLNAVMSYGTGRRAALERHPTAGKTGTTQNDVDALIVGYTADLVTGVWAGNDDNKPMKYIPGGSLSSKLWHNYMTVAHNGLTPKPLGGNIGMPYRKPAVNNKNYPQNHKTEEPTKEEEGLIESLINSIFG